jgi:GT2 family glycosyltransferase
MDVSIILVNWNALTYLRECLASIYEHTHEVSFEIIVVDNASPEGGTGTLKAAFPEIVLVQSANNLGFARANNLGFRYARGEYILLLNPDTRLVEPSIDIIVRHIKALPDAGIVGCKLLNSDHSVQISCIKRTPTILNQMLEVESLMRAWPNCRLWSIGPLFEGNVKVLKVDVIPGACMLMPRKVFEQVGMFGEEYFMYAEDLDLNAKVKQAKYVNYYVGETAIIHHGGGSSSRQKVSYWATIKQCEAMVCYFRKTRGPIYQRFYEVSLGCGALGRLIILAVSSLFGDRLQNKERRRNSWTKWVTVLKWVAGKRETA